MRIARAAVAITAGVLGAELVVSDYSHASSVFPDPNLDFAVASALGKPAGTLSPGDLSNLTCLSANGLQITNLTGLGIATNLTAVYLNGNLIQDLSPISSNLLLQSLELDQNLVSDCTPLTYLTNLTCVSIGNNPMTNYWVLSNLTQIATLRVRGGTFRNLAPLRGLTALAALDLWRNGITDVSALSSLTNLERLDLRWNSLGAFTNWSVLPTNIQSLYLGGNSFSNAPYLGKLSHLNLLNLDDNWISNLSPLTNLPGLSYLALNRNPSTNFTILTNLVGLSNLELRGNSLTNVSFLSKLSRLAYADLAFNQISNFSGLSTVSALVLGNNPIADFSPLQTMVRTTNLWLFGDTLSSSSFLGGLSWVNYLNVEQTGLTNAAPFQVLTNLGGLALSGNPIPNYFSLGQLTNLLSLRLEKSHLADCSFVTNLTRLTFLSLNQNNLTDISGVGPLTNLHDLYLRRNQIHAFDGLLFLSNLVDVDLSLNLTNLSVETNALSVVQTLRREPSIGLDCGCSPETNATALAQCGRVEVTYLPLNQPPTISALQRWFIPCTATSTLPVQVDEYPTPDVPLLVSASSSNPSLVSILINPLTGTNGQRNLSVISGCDSNDNNSVVTLTVTDDVNLSRSISVQVTVVPNLSLATLCPNADTNLVNAIGAASAKAPTDLSAVDLLSLTQLYVASGAAGDPCLWTWLTNVAVLDLAGNSMVNVDFLTNLTQLANVALDRTGVTNISPLRFSQNLSSLRLNNDTGVDLSALSAGFSNLLTLDLTGNRLTNINVLTDLPHLTSLTLNDNLIYDVTPLANLTNLDFLYLEQNLLTNIVPLYSLTNLAVLDLRLNLLDLSPNSPASAVINNLGANQVSVWIGPQRSAPVISLPAQWFVPENAISALPVPISDNAAYRPVLTTTVTSSNTVLLPNANLALAPSTSSTYFLTVAPANGQLGETAITVTATNEAGLGARATFQLNVLVSEADPMPDPNLEQAILESFGKAPGTLTTADLLNITELDLTSASISNLDGLQASTNLVKLTLDNDFVRDLSPLTNAFQLYWLSAYNNLISDISPLQRLTNLAYLNLARNPVTNFPTLLSGFRSLTNLDLSDNGLTNVFFITNLTSLTDLTLDANQLRDGRPIASLSAMINLSMSGNLLTDIGFLTNLTQLRALDLSTNLITDLRPLPQLPQLTEIFLQQNRFTNVDALTQLTGTALIDVALNELDLTSGSTAMTAIDHMLSVGDAVDYVPQFPLDSDGDGMPDAWEMEYSLNPFDPSDALIDSDGDGLPNLLEYALGTNPRNPGDGTSGITLSLVSDGANDYIALSFRRRSTPVRFQYVPQVSGDLINWYSDSTHIQLIGSGALDDQFAWVSYRDLGAIRTNSPRFFRLKITTN